MHFKKEIDFLTNHEDLEGVNKRYKLSEEDIKFIRDKYPNVPNDYINYLKEIGAGSFRESQFNVTNGLFDFKDIGLDSIYYIPENIKFFGDNFSGDFAGFDLSNKEDEVVEFWHDSNELYYTKKTFHKYIREQMLMDEEGNDLRY